MEEQIHLFEERKKMFTQEAFKQQRNADQISLVRLIFFVLLLVWVGYMVYQGRVLVGTLFFLVGLAFFIYLIYRHQQAKHKQRYFACLAEVNEASSKRLKGEWNQFAEKGEEFQKEDHPYALDLDLLGQGSLFQWLNTAVSHWGKKKVSEQLCFVPRNKEVILQRQSATQWLSQQLSWRQELQAKAMTAQGEMQDPDDLCQWAEGSPTPPYTGVFLGILILLPLLTVITVILAALALLSPIVPGVLLTGQLALLLYKGKERGQDFELAYRYRNNLRVYGELFQHIEDFSFDQPLLEEWQCRLKPAGLKAASGGILKLSRIVDSIAGRNNQFQFLFNILFLLDFWRHLRLHAWKQQYGNQLRLWFEVLAEYEALSSLAAVGHDYPQWTYPVLVETPHGVSGEDMGHPLLSTHRVCNGIQLQKPQQFLLITGSNMSGKSTFLRTLGTNMVLAYAGAPVCAASFHCSLMHIYTCMRVQDSLEKNISSFYAELLQLARIVRAAEEAAKDGEQLICLLDELFKGTNSMDRHTGAKILIKKLVSLGVIGLVSTHDLELAELEQDNTLGIRNFHFRESYEQGRVHFDYKLRPGVSTTRNAMFLMKMVGIEVEVEENS